MWRNAGGSDGLEDDGQGEAEAAGGDADFGGFAPSQTSRGIGEGGFESLKAGRLPGEVIEVGFVTIAGGQEAEELAVTDGGADLGARGG